MLAPKGFTQQISKDAYVAAHKTAEEKTGFLRFQKPCVLLIAALVIGAAITVYRGIGIPSYYVTAAVMVLAAILLGVVLSFLPKVEETIAEQEYRSFSLLSDPAEVIFESDEMTVKGEALSRRVEYAKTRLCIETAERFIILTDDDAMVILEKACFAETDATVAFLRDVFARWYTAKGVKR